LGSPDDIDMDFAAMFDAEQEQSFLTSGGQSNSKTGSGIPNPLN